MASTSAFIPHDPAQAPTCSWRGVAVDPTHSFWPVPSLKLVLSLMSRYRLTVMRWRLCAGSSCLLSVPGFPFDTGAGAHPSSLSAPGADLARTQSARDAMHQAPRMRGYYSDANIRHLVAYAAAGNIRLIPEICLPSHAPESPSAVAPAPASFGLIEAAVHHACDLFPSPVLSIVQQGGAPREEAAARSRSEGKAPSRTPLDAALRALRFHGRRAALREDPLTSTLLPAEGSIIRARTIPGTDRKSGRFPSTPRMLSLTLDTPGDGGEATDAANLAAAHHMHEALPRALRAADVQGIEALLQPASAMGPTTLIRQLLPRLIVVAEVGWHGERTLPWDRLRPIIERESAHLGRAIPRRSAARIVEGRAPQAGTRPVPPSGARFGAGMEPAPLGSL
mgnify:FL=1